MPDDTLRQPDRSLSDLVGTLLGQMSTLFRKEVELARAEVGEKAGRAIGAAVPMAIGAALLFGALLVALLAAESGLVRLGLAVGWSRLLVAVLAGLLGLMLIRAGAARLAATNLIPQRAAEQLSRDAQLAKEQIQ